MEIVAIKLTCLRGLRLLDTQFCYAVRPDFGNVVKFPEGLL